jgi:hypothetical protein
LNFPLTGHFIITLTAGTIEEEFGNFTAVSGGFSANTEGKEVPAVITSSAVVDVEGNMVGDINHLLTDNVCQQLKCADGEPVIPVVRGDTPASEYNNPDHMCGLRPDLFPFGFGGLEDKRGQRTPCSFQQQVAHCLELAHDSFRTDSDFLAMTFNTLQKRQTCLGTHMWLQKNQGDASAAAALADLSTQELLDAVEWFKKSTHTHATPADKDRTRLSARIRTLLNSLDIVGGFVMGSKHSRRRMQQEIVATMQRHGLPDFFITLNPGDINCRLVLNYHGLQVNLDSLVPEASLPTLEQRAAIAGKDPVACAKSFDRLITAVLTTVLGYNKPAGGVLGHVKTYYGTVEETGKGTLHMHLLVWLYGGKNGRDVWPRMERDTAFSDRLLQFMSDSIRLDFRQTPPLRFRTASAHTDAATDTETTHMVIDRPVDKGTRETDILPPGLFRPVEYDNGQFWENVTTVAERKQWHNHCSTCYIYIHPLIKQYGRRILEILLRERKPVSHKPAETDTHDTHIVKKRKVKTHQGGKGDNSPTAVAHVSKTDKSGHLAKANTNLPKLCRFDLPADLVPTGFVDVDNHVLRLPRDQAYVNSFNPCILACLRSNMDIKWIGADLVRCLALVRYITNYITKNDTKTHELFVVMSAGLARLKEHRQLPDDVCKRAQMVVNRCYMSLGSLQEVSGPMMAALMLRLSGPGDHYKSAKYSTIYLPSLLAYATQTTGVSVPIDSTGNRIGPKTTHTHTNRTCHRHSDNDNSSDSDARSSDSDGDDLQPRLTTTQTCGAVETFLVLKGGDGNIVQVNTRVDYANRPDELQTEPLYAFMSRYEKVRGRRSSGDDENSDSVSDSQSASARGSDSGSETESERVSRPAMRRLNFRVTHPQAHTHVLRDRGTIPHHQVVPVLKGLPVPSCLNTDRRQLYSILMLLLLKPWRTATDLLGSASSWSAAFEEWKAELADTDWATQQMKRFELLHTCAAEKELDKKQMIANMQRMLDEHLSDPKLQEAEPKRRTHTDDETADADETMDEWNPDTDMCELQQQLPEVRGVVHCGYCQ